MNSVMWVFKQIARVRLLAGRAVCAVVGHSEPYIYKFTLDICPRCRGVVKDWRPLKVSWQQRKNTRHHVN